MTTVSTNRTKRTASLPPTTARTTSSGELSKLARLLSKLQNIRDIFRCKVQEGEPSVCTSNTFRCDRFPDCIDGADEESCTYSCSQDHFVCESGPVLDTVAGNGQLSRGFCVSPAHICDGVPQCADHSDERTCNATCNSYLPTRRCRSGMNRANSSYCVGEHQWCDGVVHCADQSDESDCRPHECPGSEFLCSSRPVWYKYDSSRWCLASEYVCDGFNDCADFSDEQNCDYPVCPEGQFKCGHRNATRGPVCIAREGLCNVDVDCASGVDERGCDTHASCDQSSFACHDGSRCVALSRRCDGIAHCSDASDEVLCEYDDSPIMKR